VGTEPRPGSGKLLVAGVAGALALGVLVAVMVSNRDDDGPAKTDPAPTKVATDTPTKREDPKPQPEASKPTTDDSAADAKPELIAKADTTPHAADAKPADATGPAIAPNVPRGKLPATARNTTPPPPRTRVQLALRQRAVRALDVLLVARRQSKPLAYDAAVQHCSTLDVQGIQGWRLPDVGELASLGEAGMLGRAMYWSQTAGDTFGDTHMAWNGRSNHAATRDRGAVALCVRGDHGQTP